MNTRKWHAECHAWLDDPTSVQFQNAEGTWFSSCRQGWNPIMNPDYNWRICPTHITINGVELERLTATNKELLENGNRLMAVVDYLKEEKTRLTAERNALRADAMRYRWLRRVERGLRGWNVMHYAKCYTEETLDEVIDVAIGEKT